MIEHFFARQDEYLAIALSLAASLLAGGLIGIERSYHGRPAGFRTHALVCLASSLLMTVTMYQALWVSEALEVNLTSDPTRMAQGIMTGIGFLGAGVIYRDGFSVRGLTTAASIWVTSAIGILVGIGFYAPAALATLMTLGVLTVFRRIESRMPSQAHVHHVVRFEREHALGEAEFKQLLKEHGFRITTLSYELVDDGRLFEYQAMIRARDGRKVSALVKTLRGMEIVREFKVSPTGD